jgi:hypothetical protein
VVDIGNLLHYGLDLLFAGIRRHQRRAMQVGDAPMKSLSITSTSIA